MNLEEFYSSEHTEIWQKILYQNHYHFGLQGKGNIFENRVRDIYPFTTGKDILDCGCGWGGTSKMLVDELDADVTSITVSTKQFEHCKSILPDCRLHDLNDFVPDKHYNVALFIDSFLHMQNPKIMINNFYNHVDSFFITEMNSKKDTFLCKEWMSYFRSKQEYIDIFEQCGYNVVFLEDITNSIAFNETMKYWLKNISDLPRSYVKGQIKILENMCLNDIDTFPQNAFVKLFATRK